MVGARLKIVLLTILARLLLTVALDAAHHIDRVRRIEPIAELSLIEDPAKPLGFAILVSALFDGLTLRLTGACHRRLDGQSDGIHAQNIGTDVGSP
jgi:hypothetical protein